MKRRAAIIIVLLLSIFLAACNKEDNRDAEGKSVKVYYIDTKTSGLAAESYTLIGTKIDDQINELLYMIQNTPKNKVNKSVLTDVNKPTFDFDENNKSLTVNFDTSYSKLTGVSEVLCRAAIVKTLSQLSDVKYVQFNLGEQPLQDSEGNVVGPLTAEDFVDSTEASTTYKAKLYYASKDGRKLVEYAADIDYNGTQSIEELVIQQLINGPAEPGMNATVPKDTVLLNVSKSDGICTVDFNDKFLNKLPDISDNVAIYSVVNTLVELPDINKVEFTINSKPQKTFDANNKINFDDSFEANLNLIENPE